MGENSRLIHEDNRPLNKSYTFAYDNAGNITEKKTYAFTTGTLGTAIETLAYSYGDTQWKDLLTSVGGETILYDGVGNPVKIGVHDAATDTWGDHYILTWNGRKLTNITRNTVATDDIGVISYEYNESGIRTKKTMDDIVIEYLLEGSQIIGEKHDDGTLIIYLYDDTGVSGMVIKSGTSEYFYTFEKNLQGDIIAIYNESLVKIVDYTYDAWGNFTTTVTSSASSWEYLVAEYYNPFRYRGYYWNFETGNYYLQTRCYNPSGALFPLDCRG